MIYKSFADIRTKVERELDIEVEDFIQPDEFIGYVNDGIDEAEAEIHKLGIEDEYFLTKSNLALVTGQSEYTLPTDIYANKIRAITYRNGSIIYTIKRMRMSGKFEQIEHILQYNQSTDYYKYILLNPSAAAGIQLYLLPPSLETSSTNVTMWYIRNANRWLTDETAFCDLPEIAVNFLEAFVHWRVFDKEQHPGVGEKLNAMVQKKQLMVETLTNMVPDEESEIEKDLSLYQDIS
jgi:hypothetical protein